MIEFTGHFYSSWLHFNYNAAQIIITHISLFSLLQPRLDVAWLQSSNKGYSSRPCSLRTALTNRRLETVPLCPWPPRQGPGPPFSDCLPADPLLLSELLSALFIWADPTENTSWCIASLSAWRRTAWKIPLPAAASLLSDVTAVADTRLLCHCLAMPQYGKYFVSIIRHADVYFVIISINLTGCAYRRLKTLIVCDPVAWNTDYVQEIEGINFRMHSVKIFYSQSTSQFSEISMRVKEASLSHTLSVTAVRFFLTLRIQWELPNIVVSET
jgi:hypothetical protein